MNRTVRRVAEGGMLSALAIGLSAVESLLPALPLLPPGFRIGFSNLATMLAAKNVSFGAALAVTVIKSLFVLLTRGVTAFIMSLAGGLCSTAVTVLIFRDKKSRFGCMGAGIAGAAAHNTAQVAAYSLLASTPMWYYLPALLLYGLAGGILTGILLWMTQKLIKQEGQ